MRQVVGARDLPACSMEGIRWKTLEERLKRKLCERAFDLVRMSHSQQIQQDVDDSECLLCCYRIYSAVEGWELLRSPSRTNIIAILGRIKTRIGDVSGLKNLQNSWRRIAECRWEMDERYILATRTGVIRQRSPHRFWKRCLQRPNRKGWRILDRARLHNVSVNSAAYDKSGVVKEGMSRRNKEKLAEKVTFPSPPKMSKLGMAIRRSRSWPWLIIVMKICISIWASRMRIHRRL